MAWICLHSNFCSGLWKRECVYNGRSSYVIQGRLYFHTNEKRVCNLPLAYLAPSRRYCSWEQRPRPYSARILVILLGSLMLGVRGAKTLRLICSPPPLPLTNKPYRPRLRFESCLTYGVLQVLFTYLLTYLSVNQHGQLSLPSLRGRLN